MIRNEIDDFRANFFEKVIQNEKEKEAAILHKQKTCHHTFTIIDEAINQNGYQYRTCSKCELTAYKRIAVWEGTKRCTIS